MEAETITATNVLVPLDRATERNTWLREGFEKIFLDEDSEACTKHNEKLFKECTITNNVVGKKCTGKLVDIYPIPNSTPQHRNESGTILFTIDTRDIRQTTETISTRIEGVISKFGLSMTQAVETSFSEMERKEVGQATHYELPYNIEPGKQALVQAVVKVYVMETQLTDVTVRFKSNSKLSYHTKYTECRNRNTKLLPSNQAKISGTYRWIKACVKAHVELIQ